MSLLLLIPLPIPSLAHAQSFKRDTRFDNDHIQGRAYQANPIFSALAHEIYNGPAKRFSFTNFRRNYAQTRQYAPIAHDVVRALLDTAYLVQNPKETGDEEIALRAYTSLLMDHLANLRVVEQALSLSLQDSRFGNVAALKRVRAGLLDNLLRSGNGSSLRKAYDVITLEEEIALIRLLGLRTTDSHPRLEGIVHYTMHDVTAPETGEAFTVFINTSFPMHFLSAQASAVQQQLPLNIRRQ